MPPSRQAIGRGGVGYDDCINDGIQQFYPCLVSVLTCPALGQLTSGSPCH
jgi:hypothetical protein